MKEKTNTFRSWTVIDLNNFRYNIEQIRRNISPKAEIMQIVKADAYGHGATEIAKEAERIGCKWFGVANSDEGILLRLEDIQGRILILSPSFPGDAKDIVKYKLTPSVSDLRFAKILNEVARKKGTALKIHLNFDTGMGRDGFLWSKAKEIAQKIFAYKNLEVEGLFSHFSDSERLNSDFPRIQFERFEEVANSFASVGIYPAIKHISNSAAVLNFPQYNLDLVRIGIMSFGVYPHPRLQAKINLRPVMKFQSKIGQIKVLPPDHGVSYNRTFTTTKSTKIAVVPIGYGDGYFFLLSNIGKVVIKNQICPILGRVTMDMIMVDISTMKKVAVGDVVTLLGDGENPVSSAENLSGFYNGLSYELLCNIGRRAQRIYVKKPERSTVEPLSRRNLVPLPQDDFSDQKLEKLIQISLNQRLNSSEIGKNVFRQILQNLFSTSDRGISLKKQFRHSIQFLPVNNSSVDKDKYYQVHTHLSYKKTLTNEKFKIVCATNMNDLDQYFLDSKVEYRWLLDFHSDLLHSFEIERIMVNDIVLDHRIIENENDSNLEYECYHPSLSDLRGKEVDFTINTKTYYPRSKHQLAIYISEMTKEISVEFDFSRVNIKNVETVSIFTGKEKYPQEITDDGKIILQSKKDEWFFPNSGVVFVW